MKNFFNFNTDCLHEEELLFNKNGINIYWIERKHEKYNYLIIPISEDERNNFRQFFVDKIYNGYMMFDLIPKVLRYEETNNTKIINELFWYWFDYMNGKVHTLHGGLDVSDEDEVYRFDPDLISEEDDDYYYSDIIYP